MDDEAPAERSQVVRTPLRVLVVEHQDRCGLGRLSPIPDCELVVVRPDRGDLLPSSLDGLDGLVVLGGAMDAWDPAVAWLPATRALLAEAVDTHTPALGICLGAQLLALAGGGSLGRGENGPELGVSEIVTAGIADTLVDALPDPLVALQCHRDVITELPPQAVLLAGSSAYPHQVFRLGPCAWGVQYHPEVSEPDFAVWIAMHADDLAAQGRTPAQVIAEAQTHREALDRSARAHAETFAAVVAATRRDRDRVAS